MHPVAEVENALLPAPLSNEEVVDVHCEDGHLQVHGEAVVSLVTIFGHPRPDDRMLVERSHEVPEVGTWCDTTFGCELGPSEVIVYRRLFRYEWQRYHKLEPKNDLNNLL